MAFYIKKLFLSQRLCGGGGGLGMLPCLLAGSRISVACSSTSSPMPKKRVVFLGTPQVAAGVLSGLLKVSNEPSSTFEVMGVVSQPGKPKGRGNRKVPMPSPVSLVALDNGFHEDDQLLCPVTAKDDSFLSCLESWQPDLCITAAYGNFLPQRFLDIPTHGTLNIHPSLLPKYRGAAPVNRSILNGDEVTGVTVLFTALKMDSGPVLAQKQVQVEPDIQAPELLDNLFTIGTQLLVDKLESVWDGSASKSAVPQNDDEATLAPKMSKTESLLDFKSATAAECHNKVRAFASWPGSRAVILIKDVDKDKEDEADIKILKTRIESNHSVKQGTLELDKDHLYVGCLGSSVLEILELQPANKKPMSIKAFRNGLGKRLLKLP